MKTINPVLSRLRPALLLVLILLPSLLTGCASIWPWPKTETPTISLADMELQGIKGLETIFLLKLRVINPTEEPLEIRGLSCTLKVDGKSFASGISDEHVTVAASGSTTVPVTVYTTMFDIVGSVIDLLEENVRHDGVSVKPLRYELIGKLRLGNKGKDMLPLHMQGTLPPKNRP